MIARDAAEDHLKCILEATAAVAFMGTPHTVSSMAEWGSMFAKLSNVLLRPNWSLISAMEPSLISAMEPSSEVLADVVQEFRTMLDDRHKHQGSVVKIHCFYEKLPVARIGVVSVRIRE